MKKCLFKKLFQITKMRILKSYLSVNYTPKRFEIPENAKCLCLAPHQDDETIGMGGTLARYNKNFKVLCLTNGAKGIKTVSHDEAVVIRKNEFSAAMNKAGVNDFDILDIEDRALIDGYEKFKNTDIKGYDYIFLPNFIDQHKDHKAATILLYRLLTEIKNYNKDLKIGLYEVWSPLTFATSVISIKDFIEVKRDMLKEYKSQCEQRFYYEASLGLSTYRGLAKQQTYAEAFWIMPVREFLNTISELYPLLEKESCEEEE